jgi:hypothetical protein
MVWQDVAYFVLMDKIAPCSRVVEYNDYSLSEINNLWKNVNDHCPEYCLTFVDKNMGMFDNS